MSQPKRRDRVESRLRFTLIELLIVIAITFILIALLLPMLGRVKYRARLVVCMNNLKQCGLVVATRASQKDNALFSGETLSSSSPDLFYRRSPGYDFRPEHEEYVGDWAVWNCPVVGGAPIDSPLNTRFMCYGNFYYFPGETAPGFGDPSKPVPLRLSKCKNPSGQPLMQDRVRDYWADVGYAANHTYYRGERVDRKYIDTPSKVFYWGITPPDGANILYYDISVSAHRFNEMSSVGGAYPSSSTLVYSYFE